MIDTVERIFIPKRLEAEVASGKKFYFSQILDTELRRVVRWRKINLFPDAASTSSLLDIGHSGCPSSILFAFFARLFTPTTVARLFVAVERSDVCSRFLVEWVEIRPGLGKQ